MAWRAGALVGPKDTPNVFDQAQSDLETAKAQVADADARVAVTTATAKGGFDAARAAVQSSRESADTCRAWASAQLQRRQRLSTDSRRIARGSSDQSAGS